MANRWFNSANYTLEKATVSLFGDVTIGAVGAPTLTAAKSKGIKSIVRNSAGDYTVTFQDQYAKYLAFWVGFIKGTAPAAGTVSVKAVSINAVGGATVEFVCFNTAGAATDPASGEELYIECTFGNSSAF